MKKLMFACAATAAMLAVADGIESSNIVGFNTDSITKGKFNMISVPFCGIGGTGFQINGGLTGLNLTGSGDAAAADQIQLWDPTTSGYDNYFYYDVGDEYTGWWDVITGEFLFEDNYPNGLPEGSAFWYLSPSGATQNGSVVVSGEVPAESDLTVEIVKGKFNMIAFPFPVAFQPNDKTLVDWSNATGSGEAGSADQIQIWDPATSGYDNYFYYDVGDEYTGWWDVITGEYLFEDNYPTGLSVGKPFWYLAAPGSGTFDVTFTNPVPAETK